MIVHQRLDQMAEPLAHQVEALLLERQRRGTVVIDRQRHGFFDFRVRRHVSTLARPAQVDQPPSPHFLDAGGARAIFPVVTLEIDPLDNAVIEARRHAGRPRTRRRYPDGEQRTLMLQVAFDEIATSGPPKLIDIAARAEAMRVQARLSGDPGLQQAAEVIRERAERRLAWFRRQGEG